MKSLTFREIDGILESSQIVVGGRLQGVIPGPKSLILEFFKSGLYYIVLDLSPQQPLVLFSANALSIKMSKAKLPIALFLKSNFIGLKVKSIFRDPKYGRVVHIQFSGQSASLEVRLFPHGQNLIARYEDKQISLHKVKKLQEVTNITTVLSEARSADEIWQEWIAKAKVNPIKQKVSKEELLVKARQKTEKLLKKLSVELVNQEQAVKDARNRAEKLQQDMAPPNKIQESFTKAKKLEGKLIGLKSRFDEVKDQLNNKNYRLPEQNQIAKPALALSQNAKRMQLDSGALAVVGKSAKDNLGLLRKAKAWDYWLHLKDYPGAYGFIFRDKKQKIADKELMTVAQWVAKMSLKSKFEKLKGDKIDVLVCECRHLKPIKGDKLGRVTHRNAKTIGIILGQ